MDYERDNTNHGGEGSGPDFNRTDNRNASGEPVVVAEQPACPVDSQPEGNREWSQAGTTSSGTEAWEQPGATSPGTEAWEQPGTTSPGTDTWNQPGAAAQNQNQYRTQYQAQYQKPAGDKNGMAITSLVMGILSLVSCCCSWVAIVLGVLGIIFAIMSKGEGPLGGQAKAGLILSIVGVSLNIILIILAIAMQVFTLIPDVFY